MNLPFETAPGQQRGWNLIEKIGEGDAGEVYRVESLLDHRLAILKRPSRSAFASDLIRQASQIQKESEILRSLSRQSMPAGSILVPTLLDQSRSGTEFSERFFIVVSPAPGISLERMKRSILFDDGSSSPSSTQTAAAGHSEEDFFLSQLVSLNKFPNLLLLRLAAGLLDFLESIHNTRYETHTGVYSGILWNDIKADHIFWDALNRNFTLIDWGNAQFLESDGVTKDRINSRMGDLQQYLQEIGQLISVLSPDLFLKLEWPLQIKVGSDYSSFIRQIRLLINPLLEKELSECQKLRKREEELFSINHPEPDDFIQLTLVQDQIIFKGELPDLEKAKVFFQRTGASLIGRGDLEAFLQICQLASQSPILDSTTFELLGKLIGLNQIGSVPADALHPALLSDWDETNWILRSAAIEQSEPDWWFDFNRLLRDLTINGSGLPPFVAAKRLYQALRSKLTGSQASQDLQDLLNDFQDRLLKRWTQFEPDPPDSGIAYNDCETILHRASIYAPEAAQEVFRALSQPVLQIHNALDAWERQDFGTARKALRRVLFWDPDRLRLLQADRILESATSWLEAVRTGVVRDEPLLDFITRQELVARDLRNQIGPAEWLDSLLAAFKQLRSGADPTDVLLNHPESRFLLDWLISLEPRRPLLASNGKTLKLERITQPGPAPHTISGIQETGFGKHHSLQLHEPLDTWTPEARGSSARLFAAELKASHQQTIHAALKLMRPNRADYALPLFREEAHVLSLMQDVQGVVRMIECGFLKLDESQLPPEDRSARADGLQGEAQRFGLDSVHNFLSDLEKQTAEGWIPYLLLEKIDRSANLLLKCDIGYTNGRFLPTLEGLIMAIQICEILDAAHKRDIIYRDHKILHYYWLEEANGISMIDWNIAKRFPQGLSVSEIQFDLVQFGARALHPILTGRAAQGALPLGPNKPEEIETAARTYPVSWTYDDSRLPKDIKDLLAAVLSGDYTSARKLGEDIRKIYTKLSALG